MEQLFFSVGESLNQLIWPTMEYCSAIKSNDCWHSQPGEISRALFLIVERQSPRSHTVLYSVYVTFLKQRYYWYEKQGSRGLEDGGSGLQRRVWLWRRSMEDLGSDGTALDLGCSEWLLHMWQNDMEVSLHTLPQCASWFWYCTIAV